jgi:hypothetical protein
MQGNLKPDPTHAPPPPSKAALPGCGLLAVALAGLVTLAVLAAGPIVEDLSGAQQAQANAQQAAERERTERERLAQETTRQQAQLRAEADARTQNTVLLILAGGLSLAGLIMLAGAVLVGANWLDQRQLQRTLLLIEAQRQAAAMLQLTPPAVVVGRLSGHHTREVEYHANPERTTAV